MGYIEGWKTESPHSAELRLKGQREARKVPRAAAGQGLGKNYVHENAGHDTVPF